MGQRCRSNGDRDSSVLSATLPDGEGKEVGVDGLPAPAAHRSQCDAEERNAVAGGGESSGLILGKLLRIVPRADANVILQNAPLVRRIPDPFVWSLEPWRKACANEVSISRQWVRQAS